MMKGIDRIKIKGFRRLKDIDVELRPLTVMIGANGVGKTSFLEAVALLSAAAKKTLNEKLSEMSGINSLLNEMSDSIDVDLIFNEPNNKYLNYCLRIVPEGYNHVIRTEYLLLKDTNSQEVIKNYLQVEKPVVRNYNSPGLFGGGFDKSETKLSQFSNKTDSSLFETVYALRDFLSSLIYYRSLYVGPKSPVKIPSLIRKTLLPGTEGEDLFSCLYNIRETDPARFESILDILKTAFPDLSNLGFPPIAEGMIGLRWEQKNRKAPLGAYQLSEGTLRFLWLATLLRSPGISALTLIDEPEVSLHPELLSLLADLLREASRRSQIIVATQSDMLVRFLKPEEVLVMDADDDGSTVMTWADSFDLEQWMKEYTLDEVWRHGLIGGRQ